MPVTASIPTNLLTENQAVQIATDLLAQGASVREAAKTTGLSRRQINKLRDRPKEDDEGPFEEIRRPLITKKQAVAQVWELSARPEGVKRSELGPIFKAHFGLKKDEINGSVELDMTQNQYRYLKNLVQAKEHPEATPLFVPEWMPREGALEAHYELINLASDLQDVMTEKVLEFCNRFTGSSPVSVFQELANLAIPKVFPGSLEVLCDRNLKAAEELNRRVGPKVVPPGSPVFSSDAELDALCV